MKIFVLTVEDDIPFFTIWLGSYIRPIEVDKNYRRKKKKEKKRNSRLICISFKGANPVILIVPLLLGGGSIFKGKNLLLYEEFFSLRTDPFLEGLYRPGTKTGGHEIYSPL